MNSQSVSNEQIYEKLKAHDIQLNLMLEMLKSQQKQIERVEHNQERLEDRVIRIEDRLTQHEDRLRRIETKIDGIHISWSNKLISGTIGSSVAVSALVAFAISYGF